MEIKLEVGNSELHGCFKELATIHFKCKAAQRRGGKVPDLLSTVKALEDRIQAELGKILPGKVCNFQINTDDYLSSEEIATILSEGLEG